MAKVVLNFSSSSGATDWLAALAKQPDDNGYSILVTVLQTRGSTPRETGTKMLVTDQHCVGTIGGGHLEYKVIELAQALLAETKTSNIAQPRHQFHRIPLGAALGQCCGGHVEVMLEKINHQELSWVRAAVELCQNNRAIVVVTQMQTTSALEDQYTGANKLVISNEGTCGTLGSGGRDAEAIDKARDLLNSPAQLNILRQDDLVFDSLIDHSPEVILFGAGHVGQAIVRILQDVSCRVNCIDSREEIIAKLPRALNLRATFSEDPAIEIDHARTGSYILVMTHNHQLDLAICERALKRSDLAFCGLIGSLTKRRRFIKQLTAKGFNLNELDRLTCPIGIGGITGKAPAQIAVATAAQLLQLFEHHHFVPSNAYS